MWRAARISAKNVSRFEMKQTDVLAGEARLPLTPNYLVPSSGKRRRIPSRGRLVPLFSSDPRPLYSARACRCRRLFCKEATIACQRLDLRLGRVRALLMVAGEFVTVFCRTSTCSGQEAGRRSMSFRRCRSRCRGKTSCAPARQTESQHGANQSTRRGAIRPIINIPVHGNARHGNLLRASGETPRYHTEPHSRV